MAYLNVQQPDPASGAPAVPGIVTSTSQGPPNLSPTQLLWYILREIHVVATILSGSSITSGEGEVQSQSLQDTFEDITGTGGSAVTPETVIPDAPATVGVVDLEPASSGVLADPVNDSPSPAGQKWVSVKWVDGAGTVFVRSFLIDTTSHQFTQTIRIHYSPYIPPGQWDPFNIGKQEYNWDILPYTTTPEGLIANSLTHKQHWVEVLSTP